MKSIFMPSQTDEVSDKDAVAYLKTLSISELRKRQQINEAQRVQWHNRFAHTALLASHPQRDEGFARIDRRAEHIRQALER